MQSQDPPKKPSDSQEKNSKSKYDITSVEQDPDLPIDLLKQLRMTKIDKKKYFEARQKHINLLRGLPHNLPYNPREKAIKEFNKQELEMIARIKKGISPLAAPPSWVSVGPAPIPNGQTNLRVDPVSGRATSIAIHPTNPNIVYLGTAQGGVYRSMDGGLNWVSIFDNAVTQAIGSIALAPSDPTTLYVGTGEASFSDSYTGMGVYRIDNADTSPVLVGPWKTDRNGLNAFDNASIPKIIVHPTDPNTIFVATNSFGARGILASGGGAFGFSYGIFRSTNAKSANPIFDRIPIVDPGISSFGDLVSDIAFEPGNPNNLIAGVFRSGSFTVLGGVYRSTNALSPTPTFTQTLDLPEKIELAINKVGNTVTVLAATSETPTSSSQQGTLRRSTDGGVSWSTPLSQANGFCNPQCIYDIAVAIHPNDANRILLGGSINGGGPAGGRSATLFRSVDGVNFADADIGLHPDTHAAEFAPSDPTIAYVANDGGIWRSSDGGGTWTSRNTTGLSTVQFQSIAVHPQDRNFSIGGTQDNGTNFRNPAGNWVHSDFGDGGYTAIDQNSTSTTSFTMYHTYQNISAFGGSAFLGFARVTTNTDAVNKNWTFLGAVGPPNACNSNNGLSCSDNVLFYAPLVLGPGNPNTLYFGTDRLYRSVNRGSNMILVSQLLDPFDGFSNGSAISTIAISPQNDSVRLVGLTSGKVFATTNGSSVLRNVTSPSFPTAFVARAAIAPANSNTAYVTFSGFGIPSGRHVWKTTNLNQTSPTWVPSGNGIPDVPVNSFVIDPLNGSILYAGTDIGVYQSTDAGITWQPFGVGLPRVAVFDLAIQNSNRILRAATHGRGIYEIALPANNGGGGGGGGNLERQTIFVADTGNNRIQKSSDDGVTWAVVGNGAGTGLGFFLSPRGVTSDSTGNTIFVADTGNNRIQRSTNGGINWSVIATAGSQIGQTSRPEALAYDEANNRLYIADTGNNRIQVVNNANAASPSISNFANSSAGISLGQFNNPSAIAVDSSGGVYVADTLNNRIQVNLSGIAGGWSIFSGATGGTAIGKVNQPRGIFVDSSGKVYVADTLNNRVQVNTAGVWSVFLSAGTAIGTVSAPRGVTVAASGNVFIGDTGNNRIQKKSPTTNVTNLAGASGNGVGQFNGPSGIR